MTKNEFALQTLKSIVGSSAYTEICEKMPGIDIHIPTYRGNFITIAERNKSIKTDFWNGADVSKISADYNLSVAQVYKIIESRE